MTSYRNGEDTKNLIISVADRIFWEKGVAATTFEDICQQAHVKRSTISYHFKTKNQILWHCKIRKYEKAAMAARCYCDAPAYLHMLAKSILWYYELNDPHFSKRSAEYFVLEREQYSPADNRFDDFTSCFLPTLAAAGLKLPPALPLTEITLRGLEYSMLFFRDLLEIDETMERILEHIVTMTGRICGLPDFIITQTWQEVSSRISKIPYESLNIRWP